MSGPLKKSFMAGFYTSAKTGSWLQCAGSSLIRCSWTLNRNGVYAEAWRGLRLLEGAGVSTPFRTVSSPEDRLWAFQRELDGGRESGRWSGGEDLLSAPPGSAPPLAQHLSGNLAGLEAAVASLFSVEVGRSGSKDVLTFPWRPWL